ncbi:hypothetical protein J2X63_003217 [Agromyces sp. 3263]|uniref:hypothetical protein n=1 Tax=Agromyces sp. 3263 TaxID=2817750 RepID=UPI0028595B92|nr:hypothetical protein [Agromyces sp. 3263]MDR6907509.1 hypothetical protein [Agromyces sp. 3263]
MSDFSIEDMRRMHWSQPVEQQTRDAIANMTDEQRMLERWLNDDVPCESGHEFPGNEHCSVKVTHRISAKCNDQVPTVCNAHVVSARRRMLSGHICECGTPARDCWSLVPA